MSEPVSPKKFEQQLADGEIHMRPRIYFVLRAVLIIVTLIIVVLLAIFFTSVLTFASHRNGWWLLPEFGWSGWFPFLASLPWLLIGFIALLIVLAEILGWYFTSVYRRPALYTVFGVLLVVVVCGFLMDRSRVHEYMSASPVPFVQPLYRTMDRYRPRNVYFGVLVSTSSHQWRIINNRGVPQLISVTEGTRLPPSQMVRINDKIVIFGECDADDATITARGIRTLPARAVPDYVLRNWQAPKTTPLP